MKSSKTSNQLVSCKMSDVSIKDGISREEREGFFAWKFIISRGGAAIGAILRCEWMRKWTPPLGDNGLFGGGVGKVLMKAVICIEKKMRLVWTFLGSILTYLFSYLFLLDFCFITRLFFFFVGLLQFVSALSNCWHITLHPKAQIWR